MYRSVHSFIADAHHNRLLAFPAALYAVNNYLKFTLQLYFRPTTTKMLGNLKIFTIALLMRALLGRTFNIIQWEALFLLVTGITVNQLHGGCASDATDVPVPLLAAGLCLALSVTVPAAAAVYNEFALKKHMDTSVHLQNFFLYFYGAVFNGIRSVRPHQLRAWPCCMRLVRQITDAALLAPPLLLLLLPPPGPRVATATACW